MTDNYQPTNRLRFVLKTEYDEPPEHDEIRECLLPGLTLDLRYASEDDDKDAMRSRIKTVTDALSLARSVEKP